MKLELAEIAQGLRAVGDLHGKEEVLVRTIQKDSRVVRPGDVFACIEGERFDGHTFAGQAVRRGATALITQRPLPEVSQEVPILIVRDTVQALGDLARYWRSRCSAAVTGITGTAGKTTCKEMLADLLQIHGKTARNYKNWNNELGLALSLLAADGDESFWIMEAGISHQGEMEQLSTMLQPDLAVITNIGPAHLEGLKDEATVAREKARLLAHLSPGGTGLVSLDYPMLHAQARQLRPNLKTFSTRDKDAWVYVQYLRKVSGGGRFLFSLEGESFETDLPWRGAYMAENLAAVAGAALCLGLSRDDVRSNLASVRLPEHRFQVRRFKEWTLIDDTYNANPLSMAPAIRAAAEIDPQQDLVLVLGDMAELGEHGSQAHEELGACISQSPCRYVLFKGQFRDDVLKGLRERGWNGQFFSVDSPETGLDVWRELNLAGGTVLFKGSRCCAMEQFYRAISGDIEA